MSSISGCEFPDDLFYNVESNVWARVQEDGSVRVGMTGYACSLAGEIVALTPKKVGKFVKLNKSCATVESGKWVGPVKAPVAGEIVEINHMLLDTPGSINQDPYGEGWIATIQPEDWSRDSANLVTGEAAMHQFEIKMEEDGFGGC